MGQPERAENPDRILNEALFRVSDHPNGSAGNVFLAFDVIDEAVIDRVIKEGIDGEVPAKGVLFDRSEVVISDDRIVLVGGLFGGDVPTEVATSNCCSPRLTSTRRNRFPMT